MDLLSSALVALAFALIISCLILYVYRQDNNLLREQMANSREAMQTERKNHRLRMTALEERVKLIRSGSMPDDPMEHITMTRSDVQVLQCRETFDLREPQYKNQSAEYLTIISRQEILKYAADFITTSVEEISPRVFRYSHSLMVVRDEEADVKDRDSAASGMAIYPALPPLDFR